MIDQKFLDSETIFKIGERVQKGVEISTGYPDIDFATKGFEPCVFWVIGADTSHGKSALAQNITYNVGKAGEPVTYISSEMRAPLFFSRLATIATGINPSPANILDPASLDYRIFMSALQEIRHLPIEFHYETMHHEIERIIRARKSKVYIIDFLQEIKVDRRIVSRREITDEVVRFLEQQSKEQELSVICLSQNKRPKEGEMPGGHSFKESSGIEQAGDINVQIHYKYQRMKDNCDDEGLQKLIEAGEDKILRLNFCKNRVYGFQPLVKLHFDRKALKISSVGSNHPEEP